ncbi:MAG TPA: hypothetical protein VKH62_09970, partial [Candidatus Binatia bacterium]|nr:hypothetical protein [Candidatus Binatia bacterium]
EVFWVTGRACWVPIAHSIGLEQPDSDVLREVINCGNACVTFAWVSEWPMNLPRCSWIELDRR